MTDCPEASEVQVGGTQPQARPGHGAGGPRPAGPGSAAEPHCGREGLTAAGPRDPAAGPGAGIASSCWASLMAATGAAAGELSFYITGLMSIQVDERPAGPDRVRAARPGR